MNSQTSEPKNILNGLGWWNVYFIIKIALFLKGDISFHTIENFAFISFLLLPISFKWIKITRAFISIPIGLWLLHFDSYLPPLDRLWSQIGQLMQFELSYLIELAGRFVSLTALLTIFTLSAAYYLLNKYLRVTVLVLIALIYISIPQSIITTPNIENTPSLLAQQQTPDQNGKEKQPLQISEINDDVLNNFKNNFFSEEAKRVTNFDNNTKSDAPFDLLFLSICSVAWDDIKLVGLQNHPLFDDFDIMFDNFNSATSYSGPAVIRLLRANCGQEEHSQLFDDAASNQCYLFENLADLGFQDNLLMNHDGVFDSFLSLIKKDGKIETNLMPQEGLTPYQKGFDGASIFRDKDVLDRWWQERIKNGNGKVVALYNTISLHDGNRIINNNASTSLISYKRRLNNLLDDLYSFFNELKASERNIVVMLVPEHGAGMRGDKMQISGMREIPAPSITHVPVGLKVFGKNIERTGKTVHITAPSSYLAVSSLISNILDQNIYELTTFDPEKLVINLPETSVVAENSGTTVMDINNKHYISLDGNTWSEYPTN
jgi:cellulose synthase operon protein YhjU